MTRPLTDNLKANLIRTQGEEPVNLLEIFSEQVFTDRIRVTDSIREIVSNGQTYTPFPFALVIHTDQSNEAPQAKIELSNISRAITRWLEQLQGAPKAKVRHMKVQVSDPDTLEVDITYDLKNITINRQTISGRLGFDETISRIGNVTQYRKENSPGLF